MLLDEIQPSTLQFEVNKMHFTRHYLKSSKGQDIIDLLML